MCTFTSWEMGQKKHAPSESDMAYTTLKIIQKMQFYTITVVGEKPKIENIHGIIFWRLKWCRSIDAVFKHYNRIQFLFAIVINLDAN